MKPLSVTVTLTEEDPTISVCYSLGRDQKNPSPKKLAGAARTALLEALEAIDSGRVAKTGTFSEGRRMRVEELRIRRSA